MVTSEIQSINDTLVDQSGEEPGDKQDKLLLVEDLVDTEAEVIGDNDDDDIDIHFLDEL